MLHIKFQGHRFISSGKEDFFKVFTIYGQCGHYSHVTQLICINFHSHSHLSFHMSLVSNRPTVSVKEQVLTLKPE